MHTLGERDEVVVALDGARLPAGLARAALDDVGVNGTLGQVLHRAPVLGQVLRHGEELLPELRADDAALLLRVGHAGQQLQVALLGVHVDEVHVELLREHLFHFLGLALAQQTVVHEHAGQLLADGAGAQRRHYRRVHAARKAQDHTVVAHLGADGRHRVLDYGIHGPIGLKLAHAEQEVAQHRLAELGMAHLGVELRSEQFALGVLHGRHRAHLGARRDGEALGHAAHGIAMAHPHGLLARSAVEQRRLAGTRDDRRAVLALLGMRHLPAERHGHGLLTVAEAKHRNAQAENLGVDRGSILRVHAGRTARQDDSRRRHGAHLVGRDVAWHDLGIHVQIAHAAGDELPVLRAEIDDDDNLLRGCGLGHGASLGLRNVRRRFYTSPAAPAFPAWEISLNYAKYFSRRAARFSGPKSRASVK